MKLQKDTRGIAPVALIAVVTIIAITAIGIVGWRVMNGKESSPKTANNTAQKIAEETCNKERQDRDLCKFITGWKDLKQYHVEIANTNDGKITKAIFESDGDKSRIVSGGETPYEVITIGNYTYTKAADGTWWKQALTQPEDNPTSDYKPNFEEPATEGETAKSAYEKLGKETCTEYLCFKYKVVESAQPDDTQYVWFDDQAYQARRIRIETKDEGVSEQTFSYDNVKISEPSPVKELAPNQYLVPGQSEPVTVPEAAELQQYLNPTP